MNALMPAIITGIGHVATKLMIPLFDFLAAIRPFRNAEPTPERHVSDGDGVHAVSGGWDDPVNGHE